MPPFFTNNNCNKSDFFPAGGEVERRIFLRLLAHDRVP